MPIPVLKKNCLRCDNVFLTYENDKEFCTMDCENKHKYKRHFDLKDCAMERESKTCAFCHENSGMHKFCNKQCTNAYYNAQRTLVRSKENFLKEKKKPLHRIPYEVLNQMEEKRRLRRDDKWLYRNNRERI